MDESFENNSLDNLVIKDKSYRNKIKKKKIKIYLIIFAILIIIIAIIVIVYKILTIDYGKITCIYETYNENEEIKIINLYNKDMKFFYIINEEKFAQNNIHTFKDNGMHNVTFVFKKKLNTLANLFKELENLIEVDLSELEADKITSLKRTFYNCVNLKKVKFDFKESNLINDMSYLFRNCTSLENVTFNFNIENVKDMSGLFDNCTSIKNINLLYIKKYLMFY